MSTERDGWRKGRSREGVGRNGRREGGREGKDCPEGERIKEGGRKGEERGEGTEGRRDGRPGPEPPGRPRSSKGPRAVRTRSSAANLDPTRATERRASDRAIEWGEGGDRERERESRAETLTTISIFIWSQARARETHTLKKTESDRIHPPTRMHITTDTTIAISTIASTIVQNPEPPVETNGPQHCSCDTLREVVYRPTIIRGMRQAQKLVLQPIRWTLGSMM